MILWRTTDTICKMITSFDTSVENEFDLDNELTFSSENNSDQTWDLTSHQNTLEVNGIKKSSKICGISTTAIEQ
ncbi:hypothetical protein A6769_27430 [Nostoc punctiforme NIES-2108]|uniref:Uncharacterized protein n=1 Tax=Nostoc punctiforme NIES-2108 TaxID=1356359 RepID=A0A367R7Z1_NOSPU|nr:hypothetical protein A6769_27430 [Nostoc punctiforme NIES-2108]